MEISMKMTHQLIVIFCEIDDFCKELDEYASHYFLSNTDQKKRRGPAPGLCVSEIMVILVMFQKVRFRDFKTFYCQYLQVLWKPYFPKLPTYQRFVELIKLAIFPLTLFIQVRSGQKTGIYYIDSTCLPVCHLKRQRQHQVFDEIAKFGRTSVGWFFGLKLHLVINEKGELIAFKITPGNCSDSKASESIFKSLNGLAFGDKGYLGKELFEKLFSQGLKLITRKRKNMKNVAPLLDFEKQLLNQRNLIETVIDHLKHHYMVWHTRHRSIWNAMTHLVAALAAYAIEPLKLSAIKLLSKTPN
jgi:hypothetical protein